MNLFWKKFLRICFSECFANTNTEHVISPILVAVEKHPASITNGYHQRYNTVPVLVFFFPAACGFARPIGETHAFISHRIHFYCDFSGYQVGLAG